MIGRRSSATPTWRSATQAARARRRHAGIGGRRRSRKARSPIAHGDLRAGGCEGKAADAHVSAAERWRALLRPDVAWLARARPGGRCAVRGGAPVAAGLSPDDHDDAVRVRGGGNGALRRQRAGARPGPLHRRVRALALRPRVLRRRSAGYGRSGRRHAAALARRRYRRDRVVARRRRSRHVDGERAGRAVREVPMTMPMRQRAASAGPRGRQTRSIGELVDIAALEPDGLVVTTTGVYVRVIECQRVPNVVSADPSVLGQIQAGWAELCAAIPDLQGLSFYAQTDPIGVADAMREDRARVNLAVADDHAHDRPDLARCRRRLLQAQTQSVTQAARGEQPAVAARYWVAVPHRPVPDPVRALKRAWTPAGGVLRSTWAEHQRAARESLAVTEQVIAYLAGMQVDAHLMGPVEVLAASWERLHPASGLLPDLEAFDCVAQIVQATSPDEAMSHRARIVEALCATGEPVGVDVSDPRWLRHADGTLEETLHLGTPPAQTSPWWLSYLLQVPLPTTVAVHIRVGDRSRTRSAQRRRWARLRAAVDYKDRRGRLVGHDETDALQEASQLDSELAASIAATVYDVSVYASYRHPGGDDDELGELLRDVAKTFGSFTDARVLR